MEGHSDMTRASNNGGQGAWKSMAGLAGSNYLVFAVRMLAGVAVARILGPELKGTWSGLALVISYSAFSSLGVVHAMGRELPLLLGAGKTRESRRTKDVGLSFIILTHAVIAAGVAGCALQGDVFSPLVNRGLLFVAAIVLTDGISAYVTGVLRAEQRFGAYALVNLTKGCVYAVAVVFGAWHYSLEGVYLAVLLSSVTVLVPCWVLELGKRRVAWSPRILGVLLKTGIAIAAYTGGFVLFLSIDRVVVLSVLGTRELGLYGIGLLIFQSLMIVPSSILQFVGPKALHRFAAGKGDVQGLKDYMDLPLLLQSSLIGMIVPIAIVASPLLIGWVLAAYVGGILAAQILCVATFGLLLATNMTLILSAKAHFGRMILGVAAAVGSNALLSTLAVHFGFGIEGVAAGTLAAYLAYGIALGMYVPIHYFDEAWREAIARLGNFLWPLPLAVMVLAIGRLSSTLLIALAVGAVLVSAVAAGRRFREFRRQGSANLYLAPETAVGTEFE